MALIEYLGSDVLYENPRPHVHSRHGYFPGLVQLPSGDLLALFVMAEAFEAPNATTFVARSQDRGRSWRLEGPLYDRSLLGMETSDSLKPAVLADGSLVAIGYRFHRQDPEQAVSIPETGGILPGDDIVAFSNDEGRTWSLPESIPRTHPELLEISGPCVPLRGGDLMAVAALYKMPDGSNPSGQVGALLRSSDGGKTWDDRCRFFETPAGNLTPFEPRLCEMQDGRLVTIVWAYDQVSGRHFANHVVVSHDNGNTWSEPIDTGVMGQASNLMWLGGDYLATIHAHRGEEVGIYVRVVDFQKDDWNVVEEKLIYGKGARPQTRSGQPSSEMFASLRFGQPSLLQLDDGDVLAPHWAVEDGQGKIRLHRLRIATPTA